MNAIRKERLVIESRFVRRCPLGSTGHSPGFAGRRMRRGRTIGMLCWRRSRSARDFLLAADRQRYAPCLLSLGIAPEAAAAVVNHLVPYSRM